MNLPRTQSDALMSIAAYADDDVHDDEDVHDDTIEKGLEVRHDTHEVPNDDAGVVEMDISGSEDEQDAASQERESPQTEEDDSQTAEKTSHVKVSTNKKPQLVSYGAHEEGEDEEEEQDTLNTSNPSIPEDIPSPVNIDVELPPELIAKCSKTAQDRVITMYQKIKEKGVQDLNYSIQNRKDFRNPSIYEKLIDFCGVNENGTNYPPELYNPNVWGPESHYEMLAKIQKDEMEKKEKEKKERTKVEFVTATKKSDNTVKQERKTKWDAQNQQAPSVKKPRS